MTAKPIVPPGLPLLPNPNLDPSSHIPMLQPCLLPQLSSVQLNLDQALQDEKWFAGEEGQSRPRVKRVQRQRDEKHRMNLGNGKHLQSLRILFARGG